MKLYVKYMVSIRCILIVKSELDALRIPYEKVEIGQIDISNNLTTAQNKMLRNALSLKGLELIDDRKAILIERIKTVIVEMIRGEVDIPKANFSDYISKRLNYDYTYLANLFSEVNGITIEYFVIAHKIERVKEMLVYDEFTLSEISFKLNYSSVAHLSSQFKNVTGLTPSFYRQIKKDRRESNLDG